MRAGLSGGADRFQMMWNNSDSEVEQIGFCGRITSDLRGATYKTLIIKDLLDFRVAIFTTLKSVKSLSIRQLRDAPGVYGNKKPP